MQYWGATTTGDNGGGRKSLLWILNYALSGNMNASCDMEVRGPGLHFGFFQPWSQVNNWAYSNQPWFLGKKGEAMFRDYARLRYSLLPYIYSAAHEGHRTSMPIVRPMPLMFPDDLKLADCTYEYMFGDSLLVTAFSNKVYLPAGRWTDYWTGTEYQGPKEMPCIYPKDRAGGLFIRAGAIIPYWPETNFVGEEPIDTIKLHVYPEARSEYTLYEDDGDSLEYLKGAVAQTRIRCQAAPDQVSLTIDPRHGAYQDMPAERSYEVWIHQAQPKTVTVNGAQATWNYDQEAKAIHLKISEDPKRKTPVVVQCKL